MFYQIIFRILVFLFFEEDAADAFSLYLDALDKAGEQ